MEQLPAQLLTDYAQTFYGFGHWHAPVWFIGIEEGGGHKRSDVAQRLGAWHEGGRNDLEDAPAFFPKSGIKSWHGGNATSQPTWTQLIRMLLIAQGKPDSPRAILEYQCNRLGATDGETCLLELFPLPSPSLATWKYADWSELHWLQSRQAYEQHILGQRIRLLRQRVEHFRPRVVVFYGDGQLQHWRHIIGNGSYARPIPENLISHERDGLLFFVTIHPTDPRLDQRRDEYFREIGRFLHRCHGKHFAGRM